jgi:hypothetical protein
MSGNIIMPQIMKGNWPLHTSTVSHTAVVIPRFTQELSENQQTFIPAVAKLKCTGWCGDFEDRTWVPGNCLSDGNGNP